MEACLLTPLTFIIARTDSPLTSRLPQAEASETVGQQLAPAAQGTRLDPELSWPNGRIIQIASSPTMSATGCA